MSREGYSGPDMTTEEGRAGLRRRLDERHHLLPLVVASKTEVRSDEEFEDWARSKMDDGEMYGDHDE